MPKETGHESSKSTSAAKRATTNGEKKPHAQTSSTSGKSAKTNGAPRPDLGVEILEKQGRKPLNAQSWALIAIGIAFLVGGFVVFFGLGRLPRDRHNISLLIACIGFAIVLTEIGTRAAVRHTSLNTSLIVTGAGALALIFYVVVNPIALCQFGYGDNCPHPEAVRKFSGKVKILSGDFDPRAFSVVVEPQARSANHIGENVIAWNAKVPVRVNGEGSVEEPKHIILYYGKHQPVAYAVPDEIGTATYDFEKVLEFSPLDELSEPSSDNPPPLLQLGAM